MPVTGGAGGVRYRAEDVHALRISDDGSTLEVAVLGEDETTFDAGDQLIFGRPSTYEISSGGSLNLVLDEELTVEGGSEALIALSPQGDYVAQVYEPLAVVRYSGSVYVALAQVPADRPPPDEEYWREMQRGSEPLTAEGQLLTHDGTSEVPLPPPAIAPEKKVLRSLGTGKRPQWVEASWPGPETEVLGSSLPRVAAPGTTPWLRNPAAPEAGPHQGFDVRDLGPVRSCRGSAMTYMSSWLNSQNEYMSLGYDGTVTTAYHLHAYKEMAISALYGGLAADEYFIQAWSDHSYASWALTNKGNLFVKGPNSQGPLGVGNASTHRSWVRCPYLGPAASIAGLSCELAAFVIGHSGGDNNNTLTHCYAIDIHGRVLGWGYNGHGEVGQGNITSPVTTPALIPFPEAIVQISAAKFAAAFVGVSGQLYTLGRNSDGELGAGDTTTRSVPYTVPGMTGVYQALMVSGSDYSSTHGVCFALKTDGTLWSCGLNEFGQLGLGDTTSRSTFTQVAGSYSSVYAAGCRWMSICAIGGSPGSPNGEIHTWGYNQKGACGDGTLVDVLSPGRPTTASLYSDSPTGVDGVLTPNPIPFPRDNIIAVFPMGRSSSRGGFCLIDDSNRLWHFGVAWRWCPSNVVGLDTYHNIPQPYLMPGPWSQGDRSVQIDDILASGDSYNARDYAFLRDTTGKLHVIGNASHTYAGLRGNTSSGWITPSSVF
jgi:hypothetical protein